MMLLLGSCPKSNPRAHGRVITVDYESSFAVTAAQIHAMGGEIHSSSRVQHTKSCRMTFADIGGR